MVYRSEVLLRSVCEGGEEFRREVHSAEQNADLQAAVQRPRISSTVWTVSC